MSNSPATSFSAALLDPALSPPAINGRNDRDRERRFDVYRNNVVASLVNALAATFPVVHALVGDEFFRGMARIYVAESPPRSRVVADHGAGLPAFIAGFAPAAGLPYLADVATAEWLQLRAYHDADAAPIARDAYTALLADPDRLSRLRVGLHPACRWLSSGFAVASLWHAHQAPTPDLSLIDLDQPQDVLIARPVFDVHVVAMPPGGSAWLDALSRGKTLADAFADNVDASHIPLLLGLLIEHGLATHFLEHPGES